MSKKNRQIKLSYLYIAIFLIGVILLIISNADISNITWSEDNNETTNQQAITQETKDHSSTNTTIQDTVEREQQETNNETQGTEEGSNKVIYNVQDSDATPRIMYWQGKVNQHFDIYKKVWRTDPDGVSGAQLHKLRYCQKFYPNTTQVQPYRNETTNTWKNRRNQGQFTSTKLSYECVQ